MLFGTKNYRERDRDRCPFFWSLLVGRRFLMEIVAVYIILNGVLRIKLTKKCLCHLNGERGRPNLLYSLENRTFFSCYLP